MAVGLTVDEVAAQLGVSTKTVRRYIDAGALLAKKVGGRLYCSREEVEQYLSSATTAERPRLLKLAQAATYLAVSPAMVEKLRGAGELPVVRIGGAVRFDVRDLDNYIEAHREEAPCPR